MSLIHIDWEEIRAEYVTSMQQSCPPEESFAFVYALQEYHLQLEKKIIKLARIAMEG